jgi:hypothetical protein
MAPAIKLKPKQANANKQEIIMKTLTKSFINMTILSLFASHASATRQLETEIFINAKPEKVWEVLMDFESYSEWSSFIKNISGEAEVGKNIKVDIMPPNETGMTFKPRVLEALENNTFRWVGNIAGMGFLFSGEHYFQLTAGENNTTHLEHGEKFSGLLVPLLWNKLIKNIPQGFENFNQELKRRSESL